MNTLIARGEENDVPLVSHDVLDVLEYELEDPVTFLTYVRLNHEMWPGRFERLSDAIRLGDATEALDAVLSLRSASQMIGAMRLAELALQMEGALRGREFAAADELLDGLQECGTATMTEIGKEFDLEELDSHKDTDWRALTGKRIEISFRDGRTDTGIVEAVTSDGLILWLKHDGASLRRIVEKTRGIRVQIVQ